MPDFSLPLEYYLIPFLIIVGICLILIVVFMVGRLRLPVVGTAPDLSEGGGRNDGVCSTAPRGAL